MRKPKKQRSLAHPVYWPVWMIFGLLWLITRLPIQWQFKIGAGLGRLLFCFPTQLKYISQVNLKLCLPELSDSERQELMKKNFESLGIGIIEAAMAWWMSDKRLKCLFKISGLENVENALAKGKGIILLGPHCTCLEMIGRILGMKYSFAVMYRPHKKPLLAFIQERFRTKDNVHYISRSRIRELYRVLENNMPIWYAYDVDGGEKRSVFAPFFNVQAASLTAVTRIVQQTGAAVVPISFYRDDKERLYDIRLLPALENFPSTDMVEDATRLNTILEKAIREKPEQYLWQYKRFKTRPPGEKRLY